LQYVKEMLQSSIMLGIGAHSSEEFTYLESLRPFTSDYQPNDELLARLGAVSLVIVDGVTSAGKGTHLDKLFGHNDELGVGALHRVMSFTTRPPRPSEISGPDQYEAHLDIKWEWVRDFLARGLRERKFVQAISHPTGDIYGSRAEVYHPRPVTNIAEFTATECERLVNEGIFPEARAICVVPYAGPSWLKQWIKRDAPKGGEPKDFGKRIEESRGSLYAGLHSTEHETVFVTNAYGEDTDIPPAYESMAAVLRGDYDPDLAAASQERAEKMLTYIGRIIAGEVELPWQMTTA
jgi:hypothetical protein